MERYGAVACTVTNRVYHEYYCEICKYYFTLDEGENNYCPRCGARAKRLSY